MLYVCSTYNSEYNEHEEIIIESDLSAPEVALKIYDKLSDLEEKDPDTYQSIIKKNHITSRHNFIISEEDNCYFPEEKEYETRFLHEVTYCDENWENEFHKYFVVQRIDKPLII